MLGDGNRHLIGHGRHLEGTVLGSHLVVGTAQAGDGEGVVARANFGLGAREVIAHASFIGLSDAIAGNLNFMLGQGLAVVDLLGILGGNGHLTLGDLKLAVFNGHGELCGHIVTSRILDHGGTGHSVVIGARIGALGAGSCQAGNSVLVTIHCEGGGLQAGDELLGAVVLVLTGICLDLDLVLGGAVGNRQGARLSGDGVVIEVGAIQSSPTVIRDGAGGATDHGLGALDGGGGDALALDEAIGRELVGGQRGAIVLLLCGAGGDGGSLLVDNELAILSVNRELGGDVIAVEVYNLGCALDFVGILASIGGHCVLSRELRDGEGDALVVGEGGAGQTGGLVLSTVVGELGGVGHNIHRVLGLTIFDRKRAVICCDVVVVEVGAVLGSPAVVLDGAGRGADQGLGALDGRGGDALALDEAIGRELVGGQRGAIVLLLCGAGGDGSGLLVDGELAVDALSKGVGAGNVGVTMHNLIRGHGILALVTHVGSGALNHSGEHIALHQDTIGVGEAAVGKRSAVIGLGIRGCGNGDGALDCVDGEGTGFSCDVVVGGDVLVASLNRDILGGSDGAWVGAGQQAGCISLNVGGLAGDQAGALAVVGGVAGDGLLGAVVGLGVGVAGKDHAALGDNNRRLSGEGCGLAANSDVLLYLYRVFTSVCEARLVLAPGLTAVG